MRYVSTRGRAPVLGFNDVLLAGLASDGGLYVPADWPRFARPSFEAMAGLDYADLAARVMAPFVAGSSLAEDLPALSRQAYSRFTHPAVAPLRQLAPNQWLMELFSGPTLAFKDYALQLVGLLFERLLKERDSRVTIVGATSGDTGSAAIEAVRDRPGIAIVILHPAGRTSEVQRRQMTTVAAKNVHNIALEGTFDDCQTIVKSLFADERLRAEAALSAVNSINWARIMAQVVYYVWAAIHLGAPARQVAFAVPTGNFGNVFAGYVAHRMGLPIAKLVVGSNRNDILTRFFSGGAMTATAVVPTLSPSMDIQISSNFERLLFDAGGDAAVVERAMEQFKQSGSYRVDDAIYRKMLALFEGHRLDDAGTLAVMAETRRTTGTLIDPHTAVGLAALREAGLDSAIPAVALATAHPAKFPEAVEKATGIKPQLPPALSDLFNLPERFTRLPNNLDEVKRFIRDYVMD